MKVTYKRVSLPYGGLSYVPQGDETLAGWRLVRRILDPSAKFPYYDIQYGGQKVHEHATEAGLARAKRELERLATARALKTGRDESKPIGGPHG